MATDAGMRVLQTSTTPVVAAAPLPLWLPVICAPVAKIEARSGPARRP